MTKTMTNTMTTTTTATKTTTTTTTTTIYTWFLQQRLNKRRLERLTDKYLSVDDERLTQGLQLLISSNTIQYNTTYGLSLYSQLCERGGKQISFELCLKCSQTLWSCHFCWQTVPSSCCSDRECLVTNRGQPCQWYSQCRGRWQTPHALSTRKSSESW